MLPPVDAFFLPTAHPLHRDRFCLHHAPAGALRGSVLHVHAWCEEMNKSRRMVALQARALAAAGFAVLQIDFLGCGDSAGDFGDATWESWLDDLRVARDWLRKRYSTNEWLWGQRVGCLLAAQAAAADGQPCNFLFWQPITAGKSHLQQFLRLKSAGAMIDGQGKGVMEAVKRDLAAGRAVEVAGYELNPSLAFELERATLDPPPQGERLVWLDVSTRGDATLSPAAGKALERWRGAGYDVRSGLVEGPMFWQTTDIEDAPALIPATVDAMIT